MLWAALLLLLGGDPLSGRTTGDLLTRLFSSLPFEPLVILNWTIRKSAHVCAYAIQGLLTFRAVRGERRGWTLRWSVTAVLLTLLVAIADEFRQSHSSVRTGSAADVAFDLWGAAVSQFLAKGRVR